MNYLVADSSDYVTKADSSSKIFQPISMSFSFFTMAANDRGYGLGRAAGEFPVAIATQKMRAQRLQEAHQPPKAHRRVLVARSLIFIQLFQCQPIKSGNSRNSRFSRPINRTFQPKCQKVVSLFSFLRCPTAQNCHKLTNKFLNFQSYKSKTF